MAIAHRHHRAARHEDVRRLRHQRVLQLRQLHRGVPALAGLRGLPAAHDPLRAARAEGQRRRQPRALALLLLRRVLRHVPAPGRAGRVHGLGEALRDRRLRPDHDRPPALRLGGLHLVAARGRLRRAARDPARRLARLAGRPRHERRAAHVRALRDDPLAGHRRGRRGRRAHRRDRREHALVDLARPDAGRPRAAGAAGGGLPAHGRAARPRDDARRGLRPDALPGLRQREAGAAGAAAGAPLVRPLLDHDGHDRAGAGDGARLLLQDAGLVRADLVAGAPARHRRRRLPRLRRHRRRRPAPAQERQVQLAQPALGLAVPRASCGGSASPASCSSSPTTRRCRAGSASSS